MNAPAFHYGERPGSAQGGALSPLAVLRDRHHRVAALLASWAAPEDVARACPGLSPAHVRTLSRSPAMVELVAAKRKAG